MTKKRSAIVIHEKDNVATSLAPLNLGQAVSFRIRGREEEIILKSCVPAGHKFALNEIKAGEDVIKYGEPIGMAMRRINQGEHVHTHNVSSHGENRNGAIDIPGISPT
jgi:altronate dehydratase small subunit